MKQFFKNKKSINLIFSILVALVFAQAIIIAQLYVSKDDKQYEVNLVKINTEKDSIDFLKMKNDMRLLDSSIRDINGFLRSKNISDEKMLTLQQDSLSNSVYLAKQSNRYSQYLVDLQEKLKSIPLGLPTNEGYISSNFGQRKNPIPPKRTVLMASVAKPEPSEPQVVEEKDSLGNVVKRTVVTAPSKMVEKNNPPAEADQMQFHKGLDIAVAYGSDIHAAATGTVIFSGQKGGYGNCVIISHGNGLATLYGHLSKLLVNANDHVKVGDVIAKSGNSGRSTGPHLHYEVHKNNTPVNPKLFLNW